MKRKLKLLIVLGFMLLLVSCKNSSVNSVTVPITFDHNRMIIEAEVQGNDGTWHKAHLCVDTGNPEFMINKELAEDLMIDVSGMKKTAAGYYQPLEIQSPPNVRIGNLLLNFDNVNTTVRSYLKRSLVAIHHDANLPSTVLQKYHIIFDYPKQQLTIAEPGYNVPKGERVSASINPNTGIIQIDAEIDNVNTSFALDVGATFSFASEAFVQQLVSEHSDWPSISGAIGCANIRGWWPGENSWKIIRVPEINVETLHLKNIGIAGLPNIYQDGKSLGEWYSQKAARPVIGFLGPNAFNSYRVEIDYLNSAVYFEKDSSAQIHDMDLIGLTLCPQNDGSYNIIGIAKQNNKPVVEGVKIGDKLIRVDSLNIKDSSMGTVVDALRGKPGEMRELLLERDGKPFIVKLKVCRLL